MVPSPGVRIGFVILIHTKGIYVGEKDPKCVSLWCGVFEGTYGHVVVWYMYGCFKSPVVR